MDESSHKKDNGCTCTVQQSYPFPSSNHSLQLTPVVNYKNGALSITHFFHIFVLWVFESALDHVALKCLDFKLA